MMSCHDAREYFSAWMDEALAAEERADIAAHLAQCHDCRRELARFQATVGLLQRVEPARAPAGFVDRVLESTRPMSWRRRLLRRLFVPLPVKLPAEAAALLLVAGLAVYVFHRTPELQQATRAPEVSQPAARVEVPAAPAPAQPVAPRDARPAAQLSAPEKLRDSAERKERLAKRPASEPTSSPSSASPPTSPLALQELARREETAARRPPAPPPPAAVPPPAAAPPTGAAPPPASSVEAKKEMGDEARAVPRASEPAPAPPHPAEGRADSARQKALRATERMAPSPSAIRVLPLADVAGRLTVRDRDAALRALVELLARTQGTEIARRPEPGATAVDVVIPASSYAEFSQGLARIGAWLPEGEPSPLPFRVRVTLRLIE